MKTYKSSELSTKKRGEILELEPMWYDIACHCKDKDTADLICIALNQKYQFSPKIKEVISND